MIFRVFAIIGIVFGVVVCDLGGPVVLVEFEVVVSGYDEFEFGGDGGELGEGFAKGGDAADAGEVAAVEEDVGVGGWKVEGGGG